MRIIQTFRTAGRDKRHVLTMRIRLLCGLLCLHLTLGAQLTRRSDGSYRFEPLLDRLYKFAQIIPQEKVYVHMDNTCYFQGDTIWFAAYTRKTNTDTPSDVSGVLYAELLNNEGYLVERKLIEMREGRGQGFFALNNTIQYSGFYELRAYTRWQLNWGMYEHKHSLPAHNWFNGKKEEEKLFYRDYEKLYSRVFPVYDRPQEPGGFDHNMTSRIMRRTFKKDIDEAERKPTLTFYPEGGHLVAGVPNRVAFEAVMNDGEWLEGNLTSLTPTQPHPLPLSGERGDSILTLNRGRGVFTIVPEAGREYEMTFTATDGRTVKAKLPKAEKVGAAIQVKQEGDSVFIDTRLAGLSMDTLALTVMHEGRVEEFIVHSAQCTIPLSRLRCGVNQVTLFDAAGRVYADRLFFVRKADEMQPTLHIDGLQNDYLPYDSIGFTVQGQARGATVSLAVRDAFLQDPLYDNASIMTEMLLSSEIRGFVPDPGWFFEADDEEHRRALDLLMMTQGWRRFNWRQMAVQGEWELVQPDEQAPIIIGKAYEATDTLTNENNGQPKVAEEDAFGNKTAAKPEDYTIRKKSKREVVVHAELAEAGSLSSPVIGKLKTKNQHFRLQLPPFYGKTIFFLSAADTTGWPAGRIHTYPWIQMVADVRGIERKYQRKLFYDEVRWQVRVQWPYPRFVKPYNFYQEQCKESSTPVGEERKKLADGTEQLREVAVKARRNGMWRFNDSQPTMIMDWYDANNFAMDACLPLVRALCSDYGSPYPYVNIDPKTPNYHPEDRDRIYTIYGPSPEERLDPPWCDIPVDSIYAPKYLNTWGLFSSRKGGGGDMDKVILYTDYCPRLEGSKRYQGSDLPETRVAYYPYYDGSLRVVYRDRRYVLDGFAYPAEFYSPDYSQQQPQEPTDYRRTLYWNPALRLDSNGQARVTLYNNSRSAQVSISAAGQAGNGTLLWNKE